MEENSGASQQPNKESSKGYGKRPLWQWVVVYLVLAVIVYGLVYYLFMRDSGSLY